MKSIGDAVIVKRKAGGPAVRPGDRVRILVDEHRSKRPYGTVQEVGYRRGKVVVVVERDHIPKRATNTGRLPLKVVTMPLSSVVPLWSRWRPKSTPSRQVPRPSRARNTCIGALETQRAIVVE